MKYPKQYSFLYIRFYCLYKYRTSFLYVKDIRINYDYSEWNKQLS